eukprot:353840-Chlamydomonas_euryale.AAC.2
MRGGGAQTFAHVNGVVCTRCKARKISCRTWHKGLALCAKSGAGAGWVEVLGESLGIHQGNVGSRTTDICMHVACRQAWLGRAAEGTFRGTLTLAVCDAMEGWEGCVRMWGAAPRMT